MEKCKKEVAVAQQMSPRKIWYKNIRNSHKNMKYLVRQMVEEVHEQAKEGSLTESVVFCLWPGLSGCCWGRVWRTLWSDCLSWPPKRCTRLRWKQACGRVGRIVEYNDKYLRLFYGRIFWPAYDKSHFASLRWKCDDMMFTIIKVSFKVLKWLCRAEDFQNKMAHNWKGGRKKEQLKDKLTARRYVKIWKYHWSMWVRIKYGSPCKMFLVSFNSSVFF